MPMSTLFTPIRGEEECATGLVRNAEMQHNHMAAPKFPFPRGEGSRIARYDLAGRVLVQYADGKRVVVEKRERICGTKEIVEMRRQLCRAAGLQVGARGAMPVPPAARRAPPP